jgi:hypothetical protein
MDKTAYVVTIDEEFQKSQVKGFVRTKKGNLERVNPFERKGSQRLFTGGRSPEQTLKRELSRMAKIEKEGLPKVYKTFKDYLYDYFPDFSWNPKGSEMEFKKLLGSDKWLKLAKKVKDKYGYDFVSQVKAGIKEAKAARY